MKDTRLRIKLFGTSNDDCLNVRCYGCDPNGETGFIGQTVRELKGALFRIGVLEDKIIELESKKTRRRKR